MIRTIVTIGTVLVVATTIIELPMGINHCRCYGATNPDNNPDENTVLSGKEYLFQMDPFLVNLNDRDLNRYLQVSFVLSLSSKKVESEIKEKLPLLTDAILGYLSTRTYDEVVSRIGKKEIKKSITKLVNSCLTSGYVKSVFITRFIVQ